MGQEMGLPTPFLSRLGRWISPFIRDDRGNFAVVTAVLLIPVMTAAGGIVDIVTAYDNQGLLQIASDSAALAASVVEISERETVAEAMFRSNIDARLPQAQATLVTNSDGSVTVTAKYQAPTFFLAIIGMHELTVSVSARARALSTSDTTQTQTTTTTVEKHASVCMLATTANWGNALLVNSPANVDGGDCEVHVRSSANDAFMFNSSTTFNAAKFCIKGTATVRGSTNGTIETACNAADDTIGSLLPTPPSSGCTFNNYTPPVSSSLVLVPGTYCGWTNFNGSPNITLTSGLYVIRDGGWNLNDGTSLTGSGVSFYLDGSYATVQMNGKISWDVTAPSSGTYKGILYFQKPTLGASNFIFNGQNGQRLEGLIYLPTQNIQFKSKSKLGTTDKITVVANTIMITGEAAWRFTGHPDFKVPGSTTYESVTMTTTTVIPGEQEPPRLMK